LYAFSIKVDSANPVYSKLNVNYFLVVGASEVFERNSEFEEVFRFQEKKIYTRKILNEEP
jgi:chemotaxis methyl-accepting protein methylase